MSLEKEPSFFFLNFVTNSFNTVFLGFYIIIPVLSSNNQTYLVKPVDTSISLTKL